MMSYRERKDYLLRTGWVPSGSGEGLRWKKSAGGELLLTGSAVSYQRKLDKGEMQYLKCEDCEHWVFTVKGPSVCFPCRTRRAARSRGALQEPTKSVQVAESLHGRLMEIASAKGVYMTRILDEAIRAGLEVLHGQ